MLYHLQHMSHVVLVKLAQPNSELATSLPGDARLNQRWVLSQAPPLHLFKIVQPILDLICGRSLQPL
jgi:hypothetical protein